MPLKKMKNKKKAFTSSDQPTRLTACADRIVSVHVITA